MACLSDYDIKILLAFGQALSGKKKFSDFLLLHNFEELAALAAAIH